MSFGKVSMMGLLWPLGLMISGAGQIAPAEAQERAVEFQVESPIMLTKGSVTVLESDLDGYLAARVPSEDIPALLSNADRLGRILENLVRTNAFHDLARSEGLLDSTRNQARLLYVLARQAENIYREHYLTSIELDNYEDRARELYLARPGDFMHTPSIDFDHLLVTVGEDRSETEAMSLMVKLHEKLTTGSDFNEVAGEFSEDSTFAENGGAYTNIDPSMLVPVLANAIEGLSEGEWTDPVRSQFGWHLARLTAINDREPMGWEEARPVALQVAREEHLTNALERLIRDIHDAEAVFTEGTIERLYRRYDVPTESAVNIPEIGAIEVQ